MSTTAPSPSAHAPHTARNAAIVGSVVLMHGVALWAVNQGLLRPPVDLIVPAQILAEFIAPPPPPPPPVAAVAPPSPPAPAPEPPRPRPPKPPPPKPRPPTPAPQPLAVAAASPAAPVVPPAPPAPAPPAPAPEPAPAPTPAPPAPAPSPPAPPVVVQPSTRAAHLNNPPPPYPAMSKRLGETGRVIVRVLIGPDGRAQDARIQKSSGFERLDEVALETARDRWRYVPGTRNGVPEAMWFNVPINFVLE